MGLLNGKGGARLSKDTAQDGTASKRTLLRKEKRGGKAQVPLTKKKKILRVVYITVTVIAALIVVAFVASSIFIDQPVVPDNTRRPIASGSVDDTGESPGRLSADRKDNVWTFLVVGRDTGGGGNTDTMMLVTYDIPNQKLNVMSLPRDTLVNVSATGAASKKLNAVYNSAPSYGEEKIDFLAEHVANLVGYPPDFTIVIEWEAVGELVDAIGGVYFDVPLDMNYEDYTQDLYIHVNKGYQYVDGDKAMQIIRYRYNSTSTGKLYGGYPEGDIGRIQTQQDFLKVVIESCLQFKNVTKINELAKIFSEQVETTLTINNLAWFGKEAIMNGLSMENVAFYTMPNTTKYLYNSAGTGISYVLVNVDEMLSLVNESFNPYKEDIQRGELDILYLDSSNQIAATSGVLQDSGINSRLRVTASSTTKSSTSSGSTSTSTASPSPSPTQTEEESGQSTAPQTGTGSSSSGGTSSAGSSGSQTTPPSTAPETSTPAASTAPETTTPATTAPETATPTPSTPTPAPVEPDSGAGMLPED
ncbi:MAG: LCP family protein [Oscillospiraceae bacterium]|nr:LCP family protein [Oscillospiraceae bacterium]